MIDLALIGCGRWGRNYIKAAEDSGEARVVQVVKRGDMLQNVDAIVYAGHPSDAAEAVEMAMLLQKPILVEKPAGLSLKDAERIAAAEAVPSRFGLPCAAFVLVGHQHLFAEGFEAIRAMGRPDLAMADFAGPAVHSFPHYWDYGSHGAACLIALGAPPPFGTLLTSIDEDRKIASVTAWHDDVSFTYDGYAPAEPALTRQVRAFARAVRDRGTDDWRFGARWAVKVAQILEAASPDV